MLSNAAAMAVSAALYLLCTSDCCHGAENLAVALLIDLRPEERSPRLVVYSHMIVTAQYHLQAFFVGHTNNFEVKTDTTFVVNYRNMQSAQTRARANTFSSKRNVSWAIRSQVYQCRPEMMLLEGSRMLHIMLISKQKGWLVGAVLLFRDARISRH